MSDRDERDVLPEDVTARLVSIAPQVPTLAEVQRVAARAVRTVADLGTTRRGQTRTAGVRPIVAVAAAVLLLALLAGAAYAVSRAVSSARTPLGGAPSLPKPPATVDVQSIPTASVAPTETEPAGGVPSKPKARPTGLTAAQAIAAAGKEWGMNLTDPPAGVSVTARKMRLGDVRFPGEVSEGGNVVPSVSNNTLVWVVTVDGLSIPSSGGPAHPSSGTPGPAPKPHTQENIVINAQTGAFVMSCTYK